MLELVLALIQNVALLGVAVLFAPLMIGYQPRLPASLRNVLLGIVFGLACLLVTLLPVVSPDGAVLDGRAGPVLFAGYLGGPVGGIIAAAIGSIGRLAAGGPFVFSGVIIFFVYGLVGALTARVLTRRREIDRIRIGDVGLLFVLSAIAVANMYWLIQPAERANRWIADDLPLILMANLLSIAVLGTLLRVVFDLLRERDRTGRLAERLELATTAADIGIWDYDVKRDAVVWDDRQCRLHGIPPGSFDGSYDAWQALVHPEDRAMTVEAVQAAYEGRAPFDIEFRIVTPAGDVRVMKGAAVVLRDEADRPKRMVGVNYDLTEQRRTEMEAARGRQRLEDIATTIPGALFQYRVHPDGRDEIEYMSAGCIDIWEISAEDLKGDPAPLWAAVDETYLEQMQSSVTTSAENLTPWVFQWPITTPSGKTKWLDGRGWPRRHDDGSVEWSSVILDVTAQVQTKQALERSQKLYFEVQKVDSIGKLTGGIAHDFNNLLAVILGNLELNRKEQLSDEAQAGLEDAITACQRGAALTQQLLAFGRQAVLRPEALNLDTVVADTANLVKRTFREDIRIEVVRSGGLWNTLLDRSALESALLNIAINARDAMTEGGTLTFETANVRLGEEYLEERGEETPPGRYVMVAITDTGTGIAPEEISKVFEPFYTTKPVGEGSGMGLAMVHGFVKQSGGLVRIYSEPGVGTSLKMYFPASEAPVTPAQEVTPPDVAGGEERIMLVEDNALVRRTISRQLGAIGYRVAVAENGQRALELYDKEGPFDLLITDVVMPGPLQGPALAKRIRALRPGIPVIFMSGYPQEAAIHGNGLSPQDVQLMKPVSFSALARAIRQALSSPTSA